MRPKGIPQSNPPTWLRLRCGHVVLFSPPVPQANDELTCGVCGEPTEVAA